MRVVNPAATFTDAGTDAPPEAESEIVAPPAGATRANVIVPTAELPPTTAVGFEDTVKRSGVRMVSVPDAEFPLSAPVIVAVTVVATDDVVMANVADVEPDGITTDVGTAALAELEVRLTVMPPVGAGPLRVTVPVADVPPVTVVGEMLTELSVVGVITNVVDLAVPPWPANKVTDVD